MRLSGGGFCVFLPYDLCGTVFDVNNECTLFIMRNLILLIIATLASVVVFAAEPRLSLNVNYTTTGLYDISDNRANWVNLLDASTDVRLWRGGEASLNLIAVNNLRNFLGRGGVIDELTVFSSIEDGSVPLSLFKFGLSQRFGRVTLFGGVRNVNGDYFNSSWNSMFTTSTNGLFPTLAHNFSIADSPAAAMCLHVEWNITDNVTLKNSLYNGIASDGWDAVFRVRPSRDGVFNITQLGYEGDDKGYRGNYYLGYAIGNSYSAEHGCKYERWSLYALVEQPVWKTTSERALLLLAQAGFAPDCCCDKYWGAGLVWHGVFTKSDDALGVMTNTAWHDDGRELDTELCYSLTRGCATFCPAVHWVHAHGREYFVGVLKIGFNFGFER